ncbi:MAG: hypothetical protein PHG13_02175 [Candidatus Pacebacteria bacterium]|nr:hypothetical protein [Candidatus Paceibacterota bacterium]MDD5721787.1 hypothetical protein [Candidatus Paceibacterota bacterium]
MVNPVPKYRYHVLTSIKAAKLSIEMFNRIDSEHSNQAALIFNSQSWELLAKGLLIRNKINIYNSDGTTITVEKAVNKLFHQLKLLSLEENKTMQQTISLRNEALHGILPKIDQEIIIHLLYFSLYTFHRILKEKFKTYFSDFDKNFLAISFKEFTFYSHKVSKLLSNSKLLGNKNNKLLYLLDRACEFSEKKTSGRMKSYDKWKESIRKLPRKSRISRHLSIYDYIMKQEDIRFIPVVVARGYKPEIEIKKTKDPLAPVLIKKTDLNIDYPYFTTDLSEKLNKNRSFISRMVRKLNIIEDLDYCTKIKISRSGNGLPKYNDKALNYLKDYLIKHPDFNPYC